MPSWDAASLEPIETNSAPLELLNGTNVDTLVRVFDDTTEEYVNGKMKLPSDLDTAGSVTFRAEVMSKTAVADVSVGLTFGHLPLNNSEDFDPASPYTDVDSGGKAIDLTQDDITLVTWTETVSNLGWTPSELILFRVSRDTGVTADLPGDMYLFSFAIDIPTT